MEQENIFKWKHYQPDIILLTVRWYLRYNLSLRDLVEMMAERGFLLAWVHDGYRMNGYAAFSQKFRYITIT